MTNDVYVVDTSVIVTMHQTTPRDIYPSVWQQFESLVLEGRAFMPREAYEELEQVDDDLAPWAKALSGFVVDATQDEVMRVAAITRRHPDWVQERQNAADPFLVAHAAVHGRVLVTQERRRGPGVADRNLKIPNVADEEGVECLTTHDVARREGWVF